MRLSSRLTSGRFALTNLSRAVLTVALSLGLLPALPRGACAAPDDDGSNVYTKVVKSTAWVLTPVGGGKYSTGTGSLVDRKLNLILTNYHVVGDAKEAIVIFPVFQKGKLLNNRDDYTDLIRAGNGVAGVIVARDTKKDLALIQVPAVPPEVPQLKLAANPAMPGQNIHSIGNPGVSRSLWVYTFGKVRSAAVHMKWAAGGRGDEVMNFEAEVLVTSSPTNPGDSGGPLVNDKGELVGVTQGGAVEAASISYFIDLAEVKPFLAKKGVKIVAPPTTTVKAAPVVETTPEAKPASEDPEKQEKLALSKLKLAKTLVDEGRPTRARDRLQAIIEEFPATKAAAEAQVLLKKLK